MLTSTPQAPPEPALRGPDATVAAEPVVWTARGATRRTRRRGRPTGAALPRVTQPAGPWLATRFASLLYLFVVGFLLSAVALPALVLGWQPMSVVTGSMAPAIQPGSVVLVAPVDPDRTYGAGTIVTFPDPVRTDQRLTHRVVDVDAADGGVTYTTKGDANRSADSDRIAHDRVIGHVRAVVPFVGLPAAWSHHGQHLHTLALLLGSGLALVTVTRRVRP